MTIIRYHCISKVKSKVSDTVDDHHAPVVIDGCAIAGKVEDEEFCGITFVHFVADKIANDCGIEGSDGDITISAIGYQHLCVVSYINSKLSCTILRL